MASSSTALKQQAAALELKKQPEKALALYQQLLTEHGASADVDVALRNRVGDLHLRLGEVDEAIALFEKSADEYALSGFLNNAIALCNKILRQRPGHVQTLRRLARFSAEKGMVVDAQRHYLSVAEALEKMGQHGEALKALSEFAELSPDDVHVRSVVVEQLLRAGRKGDALSHLTVLHRLHVTAGRVEEAEGVAQVARDMDEHWVPESEDEIARTRTDPSLVFIDSDDDFVALEVSPVIGGDLARPVLTASLEGLELNAPAAVEMTSEQPGGMLDGFEATSFDSAGHQDPPIAALPVVSLLDDLVRTAESTAADIEFLHMDSDTVPQEPGEPMLPVHDDFTPVHLEDAAAEALEFPAVGSDHAAAGDPFGIDAARLLGEQDLGTDFLTVEDTAAGPEVLPTFSREFDNLFGDAPDAAQELPPPEALLTVPAVALPSATEAAQAAGLAASLAPPSPPSRPAAPVAPALPHTPSEFRPARPTPTFIDLAEILRDDESPASPRMTIGEPQQTGDHNGDFENILQEFRDGIEKTIAADDFDSHFDLGIAFREMGLIDDAIAEFQAASRGRLRRLQSLEALGGCFLDKGDPAVARNLLSSALSDATVAHSDDTLRGVLYLLGLASEALGAREEGLRYYQRVYAADIRFRDVAARIQTLQQPA